MAQKKFPSQKIENLRQFPDRYCTITEAARALGVTRAKIKKLMEAKMIIWDHPKKSRNPVIEVGSLMRIKYPEHEQNLDGLSVKDARKLQKEIDTARFKIASEANLPPGAVKIFFDMGD